MARKKKYSNSPAKRQQQKAREKEQRAQWRQLEKLGLAKKREKGQKLKLTSYKKKRIRQLAPALSGANTTVRLGPTALKKAREHGIPLVGRVAIVPKRESAIRAVKEERVVKGIDTVGIMPRATAYERAFRVSVQAAEQGRRIPNISTIEKQLTKLDAKALSAVARAPKFNTWQAYNEWWHDIADDLGYDADELNPFFYH